MAAQTAPAGSKRSDSQDKAVQVERAGPVTTVILNRPAVRNAVDGPTAAALAEAFADFDADSDAAVAVLFGAGGTFCAGADLKAMGTDARQPDRPRRQRPDGADPDAAVQAGHRRRLRPRGGRRPGARALVRPAGRGGRRGVRRLLPPLGRAADRRRHGPAAADRRHGPGPGHDPDRARPCPASEALRDGTGHAAGPARPGPGGGRAAGPADRRACRRPACAATARRRWRGCRWTFGAAMANEFRHGLATLADPGVFEGIARFRGGAGRGGAPA